MNEYIAGNQLRLLRNGCDYFPSLLAEIDKAKHIIFLESYIFSLDVTGLQVARSLVGAAKRGVLVHILLDGFGSRSFSATWKKELEKANVRLLFFRPDVSLFRFQGSQLRRLHRKLVVIDGQIAFVGGINIIDDYNQPISPISPRYDYAVAICGPLVARIHEVVLRQWRHTAWNHLRTDWLNFGDRLNFGEQIHSSKCYPGTTTAKLLIRDNIRHRRDIEHEYLQAIKMARYEILIANAYFLPGYPFRHALIHAASRGVRVILLLQGQADHAIFYHASQGFYRQLLQAGVEIYEYHLSLMHAKVATVDGRWSTVGSSNIDPFSLLMAREANVFVLDTTFTKILNADLHQAILQSTKKINLADLDRVGFLRRLLQWICFGFIRVTMGITGYNSQTYLD